MKTMFLIFLTIQCNLIAACDICGGPMNANSMNVILPGFNRNSIGIRHSNQFFKHPNTTSNQVGDEKVLKDVFTNEDLWLRYYVHDKVQLMFNLPFKQHTRILSDGKQTINGIGDISMNINYSLLNKNDSDRNNSIIWWIGAGIKLPNGKYQQRDANKTMLPSAFQIGTGAYSYSFNNLFAVRFNKVVVNSNVQYIMNTENEIGYKMGNLFNAQIGLTYWYHLNESVKILPQLGLNLMSFDKDKVSGYDKGASGGTMVLLNVAIDTYLKKWFFGVSTQMLLKENIPATVPSTKLFYNLNLGMLF